MTIPLGSPGRLPPPAVAQGLLRICPFPLSSLLEHLPSPSYTPSCNPLAGLCFYYPHFVEFLSLLTSQYDELFVATLIQVGDSPAVGAESIRVALDSLRDNGEPLLLEAYLQPLLGR
jgi:hypothetical protein